MTTHSQESEVMTRRPFKEEINQLYREAPGHYTLALSLEESGMGGGENWIAISYLLEEIDHLEKVLRDQCEITGQPFYALVNRRSMAETGEVTLEQTLKKYPSAI